MLNSNKYYVVCFLNMVFILSIKIVVLCFKKKKKRCLLFYMLKIKELKYIKKNNVSICLCNDNIILLL